MYSRFRVTSMYNCIKYKSHCTSDVKLFYFIVSGRNTITFSLIFEVYLGFKGLTKTHPLFIFLYYKLIYKNKNYTMTQQRIFIVTRGKFKKHIYCS